jgi:RNA polymerase sigma factor (sigma-70 family)
MKPAPTMDDIDQVYEKHKGLIRSLINSVVVNNPTVVSREDLHQVGALALILALKSYNPELGSLHGYIKSCVRNALLEEANSFNGVFTTDPRLRRQANLALKLKREGKTEIEIMATLGIATKKTLKSLINLAEGGNAVDVSSIDIECDTALNDRELDQLLDDVGLTDIEREFISLVVDNHTMEQIQEVMLLSRAQYYTVNASIKDKIINWGKE